MILDVCLVCAIKWKRKGENKMILLPCNIIPLFLRRKGKKKGQMKLEFKPKISYFCYMVILKYGATKPNPSVLLQKLFALL